MELDLELEKAVNSIKTNKPRNILLQLPDGLKPKGNLIIDYITQNTKLKNHDIVIWSGSCFGACDVPDVKGFDLLIQFGHSRWIK